MHLGIGEIIVIVILIVVVAIIARIVRGGRIREQEAAKTETETATGPRRIFRRTGIAGIAVGIILLAAAVSMFGYAFRSYLWGLIIILIGLVLVFLTRKRR